MTTHNTHCYRTAEAFLAIYLRLLSFLSTNAAPTGKIDELLGKHYLGSQRGILFGSIMFGWGFAGYPLGIGPGHKWLHIFDIHRKYTPHSLSSHGLKGCGFQSFLVFIILSAPRVVQSSLFSFSNLSLSSFSKLILVRCCTVH